MPRHHQRSDSIRHLDGQEVDVNPTAKSYRLASLVIVAAIAGACGAVDRPSEPSPAPQPPMSVQQVRGQGQASQPRDPLNLSQTQQQQLQQIAQQAQPDQASLDTWMQKFGDLLLANQIDVPALVQHLKQNRQQMVANVDKTIQALVATRNILTNEQRATFAQLQNQQPPDGYDALKDLNLTAEQRQALQAVEATAVQQATAKAIGQFMQSGDQQQLRAAVQQAFDQMPQPEAIARAMASLSLDQRKKLFGVS